MKKTMTVWIAAVLLLASVGSLTAHHSLAQYDTTTAVRVKGVLVRFEQVNPHSVLFIDEKRADGQIVRWAVEGPGPNQLRRMNVALDTFRIGDVIEACGYLTKDGRDRTVTTETIDSYQKLAPPKTISGRLMDGEEIVLPSGEKQKWSDYGFHRCLGADFTDFHSK